MEYTGKSRAFTLIELLVVIAIIALLLAILTPSLKKAKDSAKKLLCLSNERQVGLSLQAYLLEHDDRLPPSSCHLDNPDQYWLKILADYTQTQLLFCCPSDRSKNFVNWDRPLDEQEDGLRWSSFALNSLLDPDCPYYNIGRYNKVSNIKRPRYYIYVSEAPDNWTSADHFHPETWRKIDQIKGQIAWDRHKNQTANYVFADGHAENLHVEQTWQRPGRCYWYPSDAPGWPDYLIKK